MNSDVMGLVGKWRRQAAENYNDRGNALERCASDLEAALNAQAPVACELTQPQLDSIVDAYLAEQREGGSLWACIQEAMQVYSVYLAPPSNTALQARMARLEALLSEAVHRLDDMLTGDDGQAWKEAEKWRNRHRAEIDAALAAGTKGPEGLG